MPPQECPRTENAIEDARREVAADATGAIPRVTARTVAHRAVEIVALRTMAPPPPSSEPAAVKQTLRGVERTGGDRRSVGFCTPAVRGRQSKGGHPACGPGFFRRALLRDGA